MHIKNLLSVCLLSISVVAFELIWTRLFSAEFFYTFAFLILSLAILGLGLGALAVRLFKFLYNEKFVGGYLTLSGLTALLFPPIALQMQIKFGKLLEDWSMVWKLLLIIIMLSAVFFFAGMALAVIFRKFTKEISKLYMYDLIGAGVGVFFSIWMMNQFGTPFAVFLATIPMFLAAILLQSKLMKIFPLIFIVGIFVGQSNAEGLLEVPRNERMPVIYKHWDAMSKIKLYDYGDEAKGINIDNVANSPVYGFDGDYNVPDSMREWSINTSYLIHKFDSCRFLSLGAGGGSDVLQALVEGATEVHAVEVNPHINKMMMFGDSSGYIPQWDVTIDTIKITQLLPDSVITDSMRADSTFTDSITVDSLTYDSVYVEHPEFTTLNIFSGRIYHDPRVRVVTEDARAYIRRHENKFDMIYSLSSNTWAALSSGSFALAENYIFTTEAYEDYWTSLSDSGFMMMEHQFYMPRLVSEVTTALQNLGVENYKDHFAVYNLPKMRRKMILISKRPLTDSLRYYAFGELTDEKFSDIHLLYPCADSLEDNLINQIVQNGWESIGDTIAIDISPTDDNRPFVAQMGLWKNFKFESMDRVLPYEFFGYPLAKVIITLILLIVLVCIVPLNLIPYFLKTEKLKMAPWFYFFFIGIAFMAVEIVLILKYTLFIGPSVYAIAAILLTLLIASGIGSRFSNKFHDCVPFVGIFIWLLLDIFLFKNLMYSFADLTIYPRILLSILAVAPLGFFMGMPFPKGAFKVGELVDWGFAVNGAASVLGSTAILLVAFTYGFTASLVCAGIAYLVAMVLLSMKKSW